MKPLTNATTLLGVIAYCQPWHKCSRLRTDVAITMEGKCESPATRSGWMTVLRSLAQIASTVHPHVSRRMTVATEYKLLLCCFLSVISVSLSSDTLSGENLAATEEAAKTAFFETHIRPLLIDHCYECHSRESGESDGNLLLDSAASLLKGGDRGPALIPGNPQQSLLLRVVHYREKDLQMPPKGKLSDRQIESLRQWIESGAFDPRT